MRVFYFFLAKVQRLREFLLMTHFLYLKCSKEVIWIYNILLTEKAVQQFIQGSVSLCPHVSCTFGKRLASVRDSLKGEHPKQSPWLRLSTCQTFFLNEQVKSIYSPTYDQLRPTPCSDILKLTDQWFDRDDWPHIVKMINVCESGHSQALLFPSLRWSGGALGQRQSTHPGVFSLGVTNYRKRNFLQDWWKVRVISWTPSSWLNVPWSKTLIIIQIHSL